jgi:penicillin amidase
MCRAADAGLGAAFYGYRLAAHAALPQLDGRLQVDGADTLRVTVTRDGHGVPTIEAAYAGADLFFAQGFVTAQDRLWQMDVMRRFGSGELSEILGAQTRQGSTASSGSWGCARRRRKSLAHGGPAGSRFLRGLCARRECLHSSRAGRPNLPIEFRILGITGRSRGLPERTRVVIANPDGEGLELPLFFRRAGAGEDSG